MKYLYFLFLFFTALHAELFFTPAMLEKYKKHYSPTELSLIEKDLAVVRSVCMQGISKSNSKLFLATAGAPGARKTTILERFISNHEEYQSAVYLDPDPRTLRYMVHTYYAQSLCPLAIANSEHYETLLANAYDKWRFASNYIALTLLEESFAKGYDIVFGTTSTGSHVPDFFAKLKEHGYQIILLLCSCPDELRKTAIEYRNREVRFYQSSPGEAVSKGKLFPERMGAYFAYADRIYIYWSDDLFAPERLAGIWEKGNLNIVDEEAMDLFIKKYTVDREALITEGKVIPPFEIYLR